MKNGSLFYNSAKIKGAARNTKVKEFKMMEENVSF